MDIHEYQAKELLARHGVPIAKGGLAHNGAEAMEKAREIGGEMWAVKAQVHSGARGKAGGIKLCRSEQEVADTAEAMIGETLVTIQTGPRGKPISSLYVEAATPIDHEYYLSFVIDRATERIMVVASSSGGMDIEEVAASDPDAIIRMTIDPAWSACKPFQARLVAAAIGLGGDTARQGVGGDPRLLRDLRRQSTPRWSRSIRWCSAKDGWRARPRRQDVARRERAVPP